MPTAIVTGGDSGIGHATVLAFADAGYDVGFTWRSQGDRANETVSELEARGVRAEARQLDLAEGGGPATVTSLATALGGLDVFVNNAGAGVDAPFLEVSEADVRRILEVNLVGAFLCAQAAARIMVEQGRGGRIVNVTSVHEHIPLLGNAPYVAAKHGLGGLTKLAARELAEHGILVNAVAPGQIATRMAGQEDEEPTPSDGIPLGRSGEPREIADLIVFLAGDGGSYATGSSFVIDGGLSLTAADDQ
jgi:NAD(P)-dependent dehydrogenase (short-subunit alcohol dehydrogenase family)